MLLPHEQTQTPTRGSMPSTLFSAGNTLGAQGTKSFPTMYAPAFADAPHASATDVGMSLGAANAPVTNTPSLDVSRGLKTEVSQNPYSFRFIPITSANSCAPSGGLRPMERTTMS